MDCCSSSSCTNTCSQPANQEMASSAEHLANLLAQTEEYLEFVRFANLIHLDPDVQRLLAEMRSQQMLNDESQEPLLDKLKAELEALPAVEAYRRAEKAAKDLFRSVDQMISVGAGVEFAPNALRSGCG